MNAILNNKSFDFNFLIINNENIMTKINDFLKITKNFELEYDTEFKRHFKKNFTT